MWRQHGYFFCGSKWQPSELATLCSFLCPHYLWLKTQSLKRTKMKKSELTQCALEPPPFIEKRRNKRGNPSQGYVLSLRAQTNDTALNEVGLQNKGCAARPHQPVPSKSQLTSSTYSVGSDSFISDPRLHCECQNFIPRSSRLGAHAKQLRAGAGFSVFLVFGRLFQDTEEGLEGEINKVHFNPRWGLINFEVFQQAVQLLESCTVFW